MLAVFIVFHAVMAQDPKGQWVVINYEAQEHGKTVRHGFRMKMGTAQALGLNSSQFTTGFIEKEVKAKTGQTRRLYPGAPAISVNKQPQVQAVSVGPRQSRARTNKKFILKGDGPHKEATIYYTGRQSTAVKWLNDHTNIDWTLFGNSMGLYSVKGKRLTLKMGLIA